MGSPLRVATYNPLSMLQAGRQDDVLEQFRSVDLLAVVGTCCKTELQVEQSQIANKTLYRLGRGDRNTALICTSILEDSVKEQFAVWNHYQEDTKDGHWLYTSRLEFTILCYVPSIFLWARERKTLTTSSIGSVKELTSVDTDVYRFSVATPMHMWVSLVFQAWLLQVFVQHPVQSGNTIQHVRNIRDMYSDILRNDIFWLYRTLFLEYTDFLWSHREHSH